MYHEINMREPADPLVRTKLKALQVIATYGSLRWCTAKVCGCMGCANGKLTKEEYDLAVTMPEVQKALAKRTIPVATKYGSLDFDTSKIGPKVELPDFLK